MKGCDLESGICESINFSDEKKDLINTDNQYTLFYVGDPMCSWCWGISPALKKVERYCQENKIKFDIVVGGLRAGGGDSWNSDFKNFLRNEWTHINRVTGQPFSYKVLDYDFFNYDTEPACRAFVVISSIVEKNQISSSVKLEAFSKIQEKFYVEGADPKELNFYKSVCEELGLSFEDFQTLFTSNEFSQKTKNEFLKASSLKVRGFPSLVLSKNEMNKLLASGYANEEKIIFLINESIKKEVK